MSTTVCGVDRCQIQTNVELFSRLTKLHLIPWAEEVQLEDIQRDSAGPRNQQHRLINNRLFFSFCSERNSYKLFLDLPHLWLKVRWAILEEGVWVLRLILRSSKSNTLGWCLFSCRAETMSQLKGSEDSSREKKLIFETRSPVVTYNQFGSVFYPKSEPKATVFLQNHLPYLFNWLAILKKMNINYFDNRFII